MTLSQTLIFLFLLHLYYGVLGLKFIVAAGYKPWQALTPFYNIYIMTKVIQRPAWWTILAILPVVGNVMMLVIFFELLHMFRLANRMRTFLGALTFGLYFGYLGFSNKLKYEGRDIKIIRKSITEFVASITFAIIAATLIRAYTFEAFVIPTPSMEKSMMVGDFLFVSKLQYGSRLPITPFSLPLMHNKVPFTEIKSFSSKVAFPYLRLPKLSDVKRNDPVVFNYPEEDFYPVDKREHYVKRCVGLPGDTLQIIDQKIMINGSESMLPGQAERQFQFYVRTKGSPLSISTLKEEFDINFVEVSGQPVDVIDLKIFANSGIKVEPGFYEYIVTIAESKLELFKEQGHIEQVLPIIAKAGHHNEINDFPKNLKLLYSGFESFQVSPKIFPNSQGAEKIVRNWTRDNFGPLHIPHAGKTVDLTPNNYLLYKRIIEVYEGHTFKKRGNTFIIDGVEQNQYTFAQNYYWMMGDNRHNSLDSRYWGFVPEDHIVGKPVFIWMSYDKYASGLDRIRFDRIFSLVNGEGERRSYFWPFAIIVGLFSGFNYFRKKRKAA